MGNEIHTDAQRRGIGSAAGAVIAVFAAVFVVTVLVAWLLISRSEPPRLPAAIGSQAAPPTRVEGLVLASPSTIAEPVPFQETPEAAPFEAAPLEQPLVEETVPAVEPTLAVPAIEPTTTPPTVAAPIPTAAALPPVVSSGLPDAELAAAIPYAPLPTQTCSHTVTPVIPPVYRVNLGSRGEALTAYGGSPTGDLLMINMVGGRSERRVVGGIEYERSPIQAWTQVAPDGLTAQRLWLHSMVEQLRTTKLTIVGDATVDGSNRCEYQYSEPEGGLEHPLRKYSFFLDGNLRITDFWVIADGTATSIGRITEIAPYSVQRPI